MGRRTVTSTWTLALKTAENMRRRTDKLKKSFLPLPKTWVTRAPPCRPNLGRLAFGGTRCGLQCITVDNTECTSRARTVRSRTGSSPLAVPLTNCLTTAPHDNRSDSALLQERSNPSTEVSLAETTKGEGVQEEGARLPQSCLALIAALPGAAMAAWTTHGALVEDAVVLWSSLDTPSAGHPRLTALQQCLVVCIAAVQNPHPQRHSVAPCCGSAADNFQSANSCPWAREGMDWHRTLLHARQSFTF